MGNKKGRNYDNYSAFSAYILSIVENKEYEVNDSKIIIRDMRGTSIIVDTITGDLYRYNTDMEFEKIKAGENKDNGRVYSKFPIPGEDNFYMVNYVAMVALGVLSSNSEAVKLSEAWHYEYGSRGEGKLVINHKDGDVKNNRYDNLELTTSKLNNAHARLISEINYWFKDKYTETYCKSGESVRLINNNSISCEGIEEFNRKYTKMKIRAFKDKDGQFESHYTKSQIQFIVRYFKLSRVYVEPILDQYSIDNIVKSSLKEQQERDKTMQFYEILRLGGLNII